jgi:hypothetical protein
MYGCLVISQYLNHMHGVNMSFLHFYWGLIHFSGDTWDGTPVPSDSWAALGKPLIRSGLVTQSL